MSEEKDNGLKFDLPKNKSSVIKVIGIGGGGSNAVNHMQNLGIKDIDFVVCNTDSQALEFSEVQNKIQLGASLTEGLGAGANPNVGKNAANESLEDIKEILEKNTKMLFITAGMGGGTGTGAAPVIAKLSKELGLLTVAVVTMPFPFEGKDRMRAAEAGLKELKQHVDSIIVIKNEKLREVYGNLGYKKGFKMADSVLGTAVKVIAEVITKHFLANIDLQDARKVLANSGTAIMGSHSAEGDSRALGAVTGALDSPLLNDSHIHGAKNVLLLIVSGDDDHEITVDEIAEISEYIQTEAGGDTNIILGIGEDPTLNEKIGVTVIATGFDSGENKTSALPSNPSTIKIPLDAELAEEEEITPDEINPLTTPIQKTLASSNPAPTGQTDLFTAVEEAEAELRKEVGEEVDNNGAETLEVLDGENENAETLYPEEFENENNPNEIVFEVTKTIEKTASNDEEISANPIAVAEDEIFETENETETEEEIETAETTFVLEDQEEEIIPSEIVEVEAEVVTETVEIVEVETKVEQTEETQDVQISEILEALGSVKESEETVVEEETVPVLESTLTEDVVVETTSVEVLESDKPEKDGLSFELDSEDFVFTDEPVAEADEPKTKEPIDEPVLDPLNFSISEMNEHKNGSISLSENGNPTEENNITERETEEEPLKHTLDDLQNLEKMLGVKTSATSQPATKETPVDESLLFKVKTVEKEVEPEEESSPLENKINTASFKRINDRAKRLNTFNYKFRNMDTDNKEPAFKRQGIEVQNKGISNENTLSRMMVNGNGKDTNIQSSNSFLHDNVD